MGPRHQNNKLKKNLTQKEKFLLKFDGKSLQRDIDFGEREGFTMHRRMRDMDIKGRMATKYYKPNKRRAARIVAMMGVECSKSTIHLIACMEIMVLKFVNMPQ